jgi:hypothetical protein
LNKTILPVRLSRMRIPDGRFVGNEVDVNIIVRASPSHIVICALVANAYLTASNQSMSVSTVPESASSLPFSNETESWMSLCGREIAFCRFHP